MKTQIIDVDWRQCEKTGAYSFFTDTSHVVRIKKQSIPIVFIPGIMGSRLQGGTGTVWDTDDAKVMMMNYILSGAQTHKKLLIDQNLWTMTAENSKDNEKLSKHFASSKKVKLDWDWLPLPANGSPAGGTEKERRQKIGEILLKQGWGEISRSFYEGILFHLASQDFGKLHRCFVFPVYACGYNWVNDNDISGLDLRNVIAPIIDKENAIPGRQCTHVIVVSHSMGGLTSRSLMMLHHFAGQCLGAIHGAQPVTGAPAAYKRMRSGADGLIDPAAYVLGHTSALVTPVLAGCVGGLELLPNKTYVTGKNQKQWLRQIRRKQLVGTALPQSNPYEEIYRAKGPFLSLVLHPELLNPGGEERADPSVKNGNKENPAQVFTDKVNKAETFHDNLNSRHHDKTAYSYVKAGKATFDSVDYVFDRDQRPPSPQYDELTGDKVGEEEDTETEGMGTDLDSTKQPAAFYTIAKETGTGDGTVPESSGSALPSTFLTPPFVSGVEHSAFYDDAAVRTFTVSCIAKLADDYRKTQI